MEERMSDQENYTDITGEEENNKSRVWWIVLIVVLVIFFCCCASILLVYFVIGDIVLQIFNDITNQLGFNYY
jgi:ABC-type Fe3+ transport system permease subunit